MAYDIIALPKETWKGTPIPMTYRSNQYYDASMYQTQTGFGVHFERKDLAESLFHQESENNKALLYENHWANPYAWGIVEENQMVAVIETQPEAWSNRLRVTELWVTPKLQRQGIGHALMEIAKEQARLERRRALILETQSCNVNAIDFYMKEGFQFIGMDSCCYGNDDVQKNEVRVELGWFPKKKSRLMKDDIVIRRETPDDYYAVEHMTQRAFWNKYRPGCNEHYLVHNLRKSDDYLPELSRIAMKDGNVIGCILYSKACVVGETETKEVLTFGPLCVDPKWQGTGVGEMLLKETLKLAGDAGYPGIVIFGEPDYYPRIGFTTCDHYGITTPDGKNFDAFMGYELQQDGLKDIKGKFYEADVYDNLLENEVEEFNKRFPEMKKQNFPTQWVS